MKKLWLQLVGLDFFSFGLTLRDEMSDTPITHKKKQRELGKQIFFLGLLEPQSAETRDGTSN